MLDGNPEARQRFAGGPLVVGHARTDERGDLEVRQAPAGLAGSGLQMFDRDRHGLRRDPVQDHAVGDQLIPGPQLNQITADQVGHPDLLRCRVADHPDQRRGEHREPVQRDLGPQLLAYADEGVGD